ncbi:phosphomannomutase/phosphoglucomutase [Rickettsiella endosymbiont of Dermanyssus gallinae]|uniref:phosphomannomutase/phosphoglucomutase n=1 Tax=Rickettsiella endosymbiont of Dermanyssus gallinae TaxID=2856608 RepID=UPI001C52A884|nr:phosphomannomutase/phosphoglucomutase [Rickettsiella endosymbiont of Dermanyssus gallinae]
MSVVPLKNISESIFRAYDIRGVVDETITPEVILLLGRAIGSAAQEQGERTIITARDGRLSGPALIEVLHQGLRESGCDVIHIGQVPSPVLYFATRTLSTHSGVMLTASHNPANYNGLKIVLAGKSLSEETIAALYTRIQTGSFKSGSGGYTEINILEDYINRIVGDVKLKRSLRVVVDCGSGIAGVVAPELLRRLGCEVIELFCEVDGRFPHHHPDPSVPENLTDLIQAVAQHKADLGLALDGDGDRLGVVTNKGEIIWPDRQLMLYASDVLSRNPGALIIYDIKSTRNLADVIKQQGGRSLMWKTGHSIVKAKLEESGALLAGEMSGHIFFKERWYGFDDGLYTAARLLEIITKGNQSSSEVFAALPNSINTPELKLAIAEDKKFAFMQAFQNEVEFPNASMSKIDGVRAEFSDGWGLVRASNTSPYLILRFEAVSKEALQRIQALFAEALLARDPTFKLPF